MYSNIFLIIRRIKHLPHSLFWVIRTRNRWQALLLGNLY